MGGPGPFLTESTRSGYVAGPTRFYGDLELRSGLVRHVVLATLSAEYTVSVTVNNIPLEASPLISSFTRNNPDHARCDDLWPCHSDSRTYYRIYFDQDNTGFGEVSKVDANEGQPWTFMRYEEYLTFRSLISQLAFDMNILTLDSQSSVGRVAFMCLQTGPKLVYTSSPSMVTRMTRIILFSLANTKTP